MAQTVIQTAHHGGVGTLLGAEHGAGSGGAAEGIVDVAHGGEGDAAHRLIHGGGVDAGNILQGGAHGDEGFSRGVQKADTHGGGRAAAAVIGGAAAQGQHDLPGTVTSGVDDQLAYAVGGGPLRIAVLAHHGKACRRGHLHHGGAVRQKAVAGGDGLTIGAGTVHRDPLAAHGGEKGIHGALAAVGHRDGADRRVRLLGEDGVGDDPADVQGGHGALEGIGNENVFAHGGSS